ncbi:MAG: beta-lactamase class A [Brevundimonas sp.]|jgi:beta-lactamase class A|uniref:class A beta-lactamase n=1 Tax=Brevundimonas sp. TaxID=1871086 RepID=UPI0039E61D84
MATATDRRSVLTGLGALGVAGCGQSPASAIAVTVFDLDLDLRALEARHGGRLGLCAYGPKGRVKWRADERFVYCSTFKMYLAAATLLRAQAGDERLDRTVPVTRADMVSHAPVTEPAIGGSLTIEQLMKGTVEVSDNPAANILIRELGGLDALTAFYRGLGDQSTRVDRLEPEMNRLDGDKDTTTPVQSVSNISRLLVSPDTPLSPDSKTLLLRWMVDTPTGMSRIKAGVPAGWRVAHKTGTGGYGPTNDIGVLYPPTGEPVVIAVYLHATRASTEAQNDAVIADATRMALAAFGHGAAA